MLHNTMTIHGGDVNMWVSWLVCYGELVSMDGEILLDTFIPYDCFFAFFVIRGAESNCINKGLHHLQQGKAIQQHHFA